jgi:hypothetical protein
MNRNGGLKIFCAALMFLALTSWAAAAQHGYRVERRVRFARGRTSVQLKGRLPNTLESHDYILRGEAGQRISVGLFSPKIEDVTVTVLDEAYEPVEGGGGGDKSWAGKLPRAGTYHVIVASVSDRPVPYTLGISKHKE